jgi:hypothetical protein
MLALAPLGAGAASPPAFPLKPCLQQPLRRDFVPAGGRYINDHTLVRDHDGLWHLFAITHTSQGSAYDEKSFLHATAPRLAGPWTERPDALYADADARNELVLWAPHVVEWEPWHWIMFYWGEWIHPQDPWRGIRRADSTDLWHWTKFETGSTPEVRPAGGRDPFLMRYQDRWLIYSVGVDEQSRGQIVVSSAPNLTDPHGGWSETLPVLTDPVPNFGWGNLESPFVRFHAGYYYLFATRTGPNEPAEYLREVVFRSQDPLHFDWEPVNQYEAHASEIATENGRDYLTSVGWTSVIGEANRGLRIAPIEWRAECR